MSRRTGHALHCEYGAGPIDHPPLDASSALRIGFTRDGDTVSLVDAVVSRLEHGLRDRPVPQEPATSARAARLR